jgi:hypothetical protein
MLFKFAKDNFHHFLPSLLQVWPEEGEWDDAGRETALRLMMKSQGGGGMELVTINSEISRDQLEIVGERCAAAWSVPWKYQKFFDQGRPSRRAAIKLRPHTKIPISLGGTETTATVNTVRRVRSYGDPKIRMDVTVNTKYLPVILERETLCTCMYCGTDAIGDEVNCRTCGAPLPPC